jgi:hypothetical protein
MKNLVSLLFALVVLVSQSVSAAEPVWVGAMLGGATAKTITKIDTVYTSDSVYISMDGFSHDWCTSTSNRIILTSTDVEQYKQLFSIALSAFHTGSQVSFLIDESCKSSRMMVQK